MSIRLAVWKHLILYTWMIQIDWSRWAVIGTGSSIWVFPKIMVPKSSILIGFSIINHPFWGTPIVGNMRVKQSTKNIIEPPIFHQPFQDHPFLRLVNGRPSKSAQGTLLFAAYSKWLSYFGNESHLHNQFTILYFLHLNDQSLCEDTSLTIPTILEFSQPGSPNGRDEIFPSPKAMTLTSIVIPFVETMFEPLRKMWLSKHYKEVV